MVVEVVVVGFDSLLAVLCVKNHLAQYGNNVNTQSNCYSIKDSNAAVDKFAAASKAIRAIPAKATMVEYERLETRG